MRLIRNSSNISISVFPCRIVTNYIRQCPDTADGSTSPPDLWSPKNNHAVHRSPPLHPSLSQLKPVHTLSSYIFIYILIFSYPRCLDFLRGSLLFRFPDSNLICIFIASIHPTWFTHPIRHDSVTVIIFCGQ